MIDLRSDTVTQPSDNMRKVMAGAKVGDDVYGDDPTVNKLEAVTATLSGQEAALFLPTGTQSNLIAMLCHCERGDEYIVGQEAHAYKYEAGGAAVLGSIQPQPIDFEADGSLDLGKVKSAIKVDDFHFAKTRLLALENTVSGRVVSLSYLKAAADLCAKEGLAIHLDGARVFSAVVADSIALMDITRLFDSVSICLSKGLGAPVGSVLCGSKQLIKKARRWRKMLGGGMRQAGILAAAGLFALNNNVERLIEDHANAEKLAEGLLLIDQLSIRGNGAQTNMVYVSQDEAHQGKLLAFMQDRGILLSGGNPMRLVTHMDVSSEDMDFVIEQFNQFYKA